MLSRVQSYINTCEMLTFPSDFIYLLTLFKGGDHIISYHTCKVKNTFPLLPISEEF